MPTACHSSRWSWSWGANVIVMPEGRGKVLDFGIGSRILELEVDATRTATVPDTRGAISGTLAYMSPKLLQGQSADANVWVLGVMLYATVVETTAAILRDPTPLPAHRPPASLVSSSGAWPKSRPNDQRSRR
jgi:serine/threonine protein kinase